MMYKETGKLVSFFNLCKQLTELRELEEFNQFDAFSQRTCLNRLGKAFQSFFQ